MTQIEKKRTEDLKRAILNNLFETALKFDVYVRFNDNLHYYALNKINNVIWQRY